MEEEPRRNIDDDKKCEFEWVFFSVRLTAAAATRSQSSALFSEFLSSSILSSSWVSSSPSRHNNPMRPNSGEKWVSKEIRVQCSRVENNLIYSRRSHNIGLTNHVAVTNMINDFSKFSCNNQRIIKRLFIFNRHQNHDNNDRSDRSGKLTRRPAVTRWAPCRTSSASGPTSTPSGASTPVPCRLVKDWRKMPGLSKSLTPCKTDYFESVMIKW